MQRIKLNNSFFVRYKEVDGLQGVSDLTLTPTDPSGIDRPPIFMSNLWGGIYEGGFIPDTIGHWFLRVSSASRPKNQESKDYWVSSEMTDNPQGDNNIYVAKVILSPVGANKIHCNLFNNLSGNTLKVLKVILSVNANASVTGHSIGFQLKRTSSKGTGTNAILTKLNSGATDLINLFNHTFTAQPTLVANSEIASTCLDMEETRSGRYQQVLFDSQSVSSPIFLYPNEGLAVQQEALASAGNINIFYYLGVV
jgi:hypothetical protein